MSNSSNETLDGVLSDERIAEITFKIIIYIVGVIGNVLVIFVILFLQEYKKITHWYVLQMAFADIVFLQNIPFKVGEDLNGRWIHAAWLCSAQQTVLYLTYYASIMFLVIMAVDRYLAVCHPMSSFVQRVRQPKMAYLTALVTWIVALLLSIPVMLNSVPRGVFPYCRCRIRFPVDEYMFCERFGVSSSNATSMTNCRNDIIPHVLLGDCPDVRSFSGLGGTGFRGPFGGANPFSNGTGTNTTNFNGTRNINSSLTNVFSGLSSIDIQTILAGLPPLPNSKLPPQPTSTNTSNVNGPNIFSGLGNALPLPIGLFPGLSPPIATNTSDLNNTRSIIINATNPFSGLELPLPPDLPLPPNLPLTPNVLSNASQQTNQSVSSNGGKSPAAGNPLPVNPFGGDDFDFENFATIIRSSQQSRNESSNSTGNNTNLRGRQVLATECHYDDSRPGWKIFTITNSVLLFLIPLLIISICYGLIIRRLIKSSVSSGPGKSKASTGKSDREKRKVTILCALLTILFTVFWLPFHSVQLAKLVGIRSSSGDFCVSLQTAASMLVFLSSATNPYLYNFLGTFKKRMKQIKDSKRMQSILSAAGFTRSTGASHATSSSDGTKDRSGSKLNNSAIPLSSMAT